MLNISTATPSRRDNSSIYWAHQTMKPLQGLSISVEGPTGPCKEKLQPHIPLFSIDIV